MNYTLQFIDPLHREKLVRRIYEGLNHNGILLVSDKTLQSHTDLSRIFVDNYYNLKRTNGYSELEISRKREALENVLIPYPVKEEESPFPGMPGLKRWICFIPGIISPPTSV